jgi:diguanylate cyclase
MSASGAGTGATTGRTPDPAPRTTTGTGATTGTDAVVIAEFGPFDALADLAHARFLEGYAEQTVRDSRRWREVAVAAGDLQTALYLRYIEGAALQELGRGREAVTAALDLLEDLEDVEDLLWRAKAYALLAEASARVGDLGRAMDALAEGVRLVERASPGSYGHMSASSGVAAALQAVDLLEQADALLADIAPLGRPEVDLHIVHQQALLSLYWATSLALVGDDAGSAGHFVTGARRSRRLARLADVAGDSQMVARAEVIEAYALCRLGDVELAAARARGAGDRFRMRREVLERTLLHLVLAAAASQAGEFDRARTLVDGAVADSRRLGRGTWASAALESLAEVAVVEHGPHPAVNAWTELARESLSRLWSERSSRFAALQDRNRLRQLTAQTDRMARAALHDELTGLGNRRMLAEALETDVGPRLALFVDVDQFKTINDRFSHAVGDEVLRRLAHMLRAGSRDDDVLVRYGGDEFVVLVAGSDVGAAVSMANRLHGAVRDAGWDEVAPGLRVTVSVGVGPVSEVGGVGAADTALYGAKRAGRDRVVVAGGPGHPPSEV